MSRNRRAANGCQSLWRNSVVAAVPELTTLLAFSASMRAPSSRLEVGLFVSRYLKWSRHERRLVMRLQRRRALDLYASSRLERFGLNLFLVFCFLNSRLLLLEAIVRESRHRSLRMHSRRALRSRRHATSFGRAAARRAHERLRRPRRLNVPLSPVSCGIAFRQSRLARRSVQIAERRCLARVPLFDQLAADLSLSAVIGDERNDVGQCNCDVGVIVRAGLRQADGDAP